jgi:DnaJ-class molecular chaperone
VSIAVAAPLVGRSVAAPLARPVAASGAAKTAAATKKPEAQKPKSADCLACHADRDLKRSVPIAGRSLSVFVDEPAFKASIHSGLGMECVDCHTSATAPHDKLPPVRCSDCHADQRTALDGGAHGTARGPSCSSCHGTHTIASAASMGLDPCAACHSAQVGAYRESIHGQSQQRGNSDAATCRSCHGQAHAVLTKTDPRAPTYHLNLPRTCAQCHADPALAKRHGIPIADVYKLYMDSIHGRAVTRSGLLVAANCSDCHGSHDIKPRKDPASRVNRMNVPETCGGCHAGVLADYRTSVHGVQVAAGNPVAPVCIDCHSAHEIRRVEAEAWKLDIVKECGTCHAESLRTYRDTFHGKVTALGFTRVARCSDCHGAHTVLPASNPASAVHPSNRVATCGKCHADANQNFAQYDPHADPDSPKRDRFLYYSARFMTWLLVGTFSFFGLHTVLWGVRSLVGGRHGSRSGHHRESSGD